MRIAYFAKEYPPHGLNFASAVYYPMLAEELARRGHEVHILTEAHTATNSPGVKGLRVHRLIKPAKSGPLGRVRYTIQSAVAMRHLVARFKVDIVEGNVTFGECSAFSLCKNAPLVVQTFAFSDMFLKSSSYRGFTERIFLKISSSLENLSLKFADRVIANSPGTLSYLLQTRCVSRNKVSMVIESRMDFGRWKFAKSEIRKEYGIGEDANVILYVGWFQERKGFYVLLQAIPKILQELPNAYIVLVGRNPSQLSAGAGARAWLEANLRGDAGARVKLIEEFLTQDKLIQLYSSSDIIVSPSLSETFGWSVIEGIACGKRVICTMTGIVPHLIALGVSITLVKAGDITDLVAKVISQTRAHMNVPRFENSASNLKIVADELDYNKMVDNLELVYGDLIKLKDARDHCS